MFTRRSAGICAMRALGEGKLGSGAGQVYYSQVGVEGIVRHYIVVEKQGGRWAVGACGVAAPCCKWCYTPRRREVSNS